MGVPVNQKDRYSGGQGGLGVKLHLRPVFSIVCIVPVMNNMETMPGVAFGDNTYPF